MGKNITKLTSITLREDEDGIACAVEYEVEASEYPDLAPTRKPLNIILNATQTKIVKDFITKVVWAQAKAVEGIA